MVSSLSINRMASMPEMLEPMGRPSLWRKKWGENTSSEFETAF